MRPASGFRLTCSGSSSATSFESSRRRFFSPASTSASRNTHHHHRHLLHEQDRRPPRRPSLSPRLRKALQSRSPLTLLPPQRLIPCAASHIDYASTARLLEHLQNSLRLRISEMTTQHNGGSPASRTWPATHSPSGEKPSGKRRQCGRAAYGLPLHGRTPRWVPPAACYSLEDL